MIYDLAYKQLAKRLSRWFKAAFEWKHRGARPLDALTQHNKAVLEEQIQ